MRRIAGDVGNVLVYVDGLPVYLKPGDEVPEGCTVSEQLLEPEVVPPKSGGEMAVEADAGADAARAEADEETVAEWLERSTVTTVNDYLDSHADEVDEVLTAEANGRKRAGILSGRHATP